MYFNKEVWKTTDGIDANIEINLLEIILLFLGSIE